MTATLNGLDCAEVSVTMPRYGNWHAAVTMTAATALPETPGGVTLLVSGLTLRGTVVDQGDRAGRRGVEIVGGFGGWRRAAPVRSTAARPHADRADNQVRLVAWARNLATDVGEQLEALPGVDRPLGVTVPRMGGEGAGEVLSLGCASPSGAPVVPWWLRPSDGVTVLGARDGAAVEAASAPAVDAGTTDEWRAYALVDAAPLLPGALVDGRAVEELVVTASGDRASQIVTLAVEDTFWGALRRAVLSIIGPRVSALRVYRYQVIGIEADGRLRAIPRRATLAPTLTGLPLWPGASGHRARPRPGSDILVQFADGDPGFPVVVGFQPATGVGVPSIAEYDGARVNLGDGASGELVARQTDGATAGTMTIANTIPSGGIVITYTPPSGLPNVWTITGPSVSVTPPSTLSKELRAEIDVVGQGKVFA